MLYSSTRPGGEPFHMFAWVQQYFLLPLNFTSYCCVSYQQETPLENLNYAFDVAEQHLDIPRMLDAEGRLTFAESTCSCRAECINKCHPQSIFDIAK